MIGQERVAEILAACERPAGCAEAEQYRGMCGELLDLVSMQSDLIATQQPQWRARVGQLRESGLMEDSRATERWAVGISRAARSPRR